MTHYFVRLNFKSDRSAEQVRKYFDRVIVGLKLDSSVKLVIEERKPAGPQATQYRAVRRWVRKRTAGEFTATDVANALNLNRSTTWRNLQRLVREGLVGSEHRMTSRGMTRVYWRAVIQDGEVTRY
jgi:response regulator of citrate/malate metabolism